MSMTEWMIRGSEIAACNCDFSCPCQFNALPTNGDCRAAVAVHIDEGFYGDVRLDGLTFAAVFAWPQAIHLGNGEVLPIVDERANDQQRKAILTIMSGQDSNPGANIFQVFSATLEKFHDPVFRKIEYRADVANCEGHFSVPDVVTADAQPIRNPVTGQPHHVKVVLREGFEFTEAQFGSGTIKTSGPIDVNTVDKHVHLAKLHMTGAGLVR
jgi:hypothetical protein